MDKIYNFIKDKNRFSDEELEYLSLGIAETNKEIAELKAHIEMLDTVVEALYEQIYDNPCLNELVAKMPDSPKQSLADHDKQVIQIMLDEIGSFICHNEPVIWIDHIQDYIDNVGK